MVTIRSISIQRSMICVTLDNNEQYWLHKSDFYESGLSEGDQVSYHDFLDFIRLKQYPRALNHAVSMLAQRAYSKKEIRTRLQYKKFTEEVCELVVYKLEKENILNDDEFADLWIQSRLSRKLGCGVIRRELKQKGISDELISEKLSSVDLDSHLNNSFLLAQKAWNRMKSGEDIRKSRQKVIQFLIRKGYDWETARNACIKAESLRK